MSSLTKVAKRKGRARVRKCMKSTIHREIPPNQREAACRLGRVRTDECAVRETSQRLPASCRRMIAQAGFGPAERTRMRRAVESPASSATLRFLRAVTRADGVQGIWY